MPSEPAPASTAFKDWFNAALYRRIANDLRELSPAFDRKCFLNLTLEGLEARELMDRLRQTAIAFESAHPGKYAEKLEVLRRLAPRIGHNFVAIWLCEFVARYGLHAPADSLDALRTFTRYGSAEFAVRPFLQRDLHGTLAVMRRWAEDPDEHVRRLASEGSRPRLPWGARLSELIRNPNPVAPILERLKSDPSLYVRKSVANHLNDIAKDHPAWVLDRLEGWDSSRPETAWIIKRGIRTLVKRGDPRALKLLGVDHATATRVRVSGFNVRPSRVALGEPIELEARISLRGSQPEPLVVDYIIHYVKASGGTSPKVFKWTVVTVSPDEEVILKKRQLLRDFTTRRHHAGKHRIELQVNGQRLAETAFVLRRTKGA